MRPNATAVEKKVLRTAPTMLLDEKQSFWARHGPGTKVKQVTTKVNLLPSAIFFFFFFFCPVNYIKLTGGDDQSAQDERFF